MMRRAKAHLRAAGLLVLALSGCRGEVRPQHTFTVRDSAGIEIVESHTPGWTPEIQWRIDADPDVEIGLVEGAPDYLFSNVEGALLLADGRLAVADRGSSQVRYFSRDGAFEGSVGGPGEGPGDRIHRLRKPGTASLEGSS